MLNDESIDQTGGKSSKPTIAGILLILAGLLGIFFYVFLFSFDPSVIEQLEQQGLTINSEQIQSLLTVCATVGIILSIFPILGGILALKKKLWGITVICSIIGLFTIGLLFGSSILSLIALILLATSKKEFQVKSSDEFAGDDNSY